MADRRKLAQGLMMMTPAMREDLAGREQDIQRGKTVELLRRAGKEMYENPVVNTAIGFTPGVGDVQAAGETFAALQRGAPWQETAGYAVGMLPFVPALRTTWHGSPHGFTKFDMSKIGTGEGAQAYGHGLYLAESPDVAGSFRTAGDMGWFEREADKALYSQDIDNAIASTKKELERVSKEPRYVDAKNNLTGVLNVLEARKAGANEYGYLYKVDLPDEQIAKMLDWDKPFSEQPESVRNALGEFASSIAKQSNEQRMLLNQQNPERLTHPVIGKLAQKESFAEDVAGNKLHEYLARELGGSEKVSEYLRQQGIPGIQYLDQASRGAGEGTRNYVVFSDEIPQILERNGQPVAQALRNYEAPKQTTLQDVIAPIEQRGVTLDIYESNKKPLMTLSRIEVPKEMRGQGVGTQAMQDLVNYANQQGKTIALSPSTDFGGTSVNRLKDFYKQFGFVENKGRNKDFEISESMYRLPETE